MILTSLTVQATAFSPFSDSFNYTTGDDLGGNGGWVQIAGGQPTIADSPGGSVSGVNVATKPPGDDNNETGKNIGTVDSVVGQQLDFRISVRTDGASNANGNDALLRVTRNGNMDPFGGVGNIVFQTGINDGKATASTFGGSGAGTTQLDDTIDPNTWYEFRALYDVVAGGGNDVLNIDYRKIGDPTWIDLHDSGVNELSDSTDNSFRLTGRSYTAASHWDDASAGLAVAGPSPTDFEWKTDILGNWDANTNWTPGSGPPNSPNHTAMFGEMISELTLVNVRSPVTVNRIQFSNATNRYIIGGGASVNLEATTDPNMVDPSMTVLGTHEFQAGVNLMAHATVDVASDSTLTFNNALSLMGNTLTKTGAGTMDINNVLSQGGGAVNIQQGTVTGNGTIGGDVNNNGGTISPGNSLQQVSGVPEPGTLVLVMIGAAGLVAFRRTFPRMRQPQHRELSPSIEKN